MSKKELRVSSTIPEDRWQDVTLISVDIETNTEDPLGKKEGLGKYGLSYNAEITDVALLDIKGNRGLVFQTPTEAQKKFIAELLGKDNITVVAHNAIFDLRQLGGHYGFQLARHSLVWDTKTIGVKLMMGDLQARGFDLLSFAKRLGADKLPFSPEFIEEMKVHRKDLANLPTVMQSLPADNPLWGEVGGYMPPPPRYVDGKDLTLDEYVEKYKKELIDFMAAAKAAVAKYVLSDTLLAAQIYEKQVEAIEAMSKGHHRIGGWYHVPIWKALKTSLGWWLRNLRVMSNQSIRGIKMDTKYTEQKIAEYKTNLAEEMVKVLAVPDNSDPYQDFNKVISTLYYYSRVLDVCRDSNNKYSNPKGWAYWEFVKLSKVVLRDAIPGISDEWIDFLVALDPTGVTRGQVLKTAPKTHVPVLNLEKYIERSCFSGKDGSEFLARTKTRWWVAYYTATKSSKPTRESMLNKKSFKPYYLFVICGVPLPTAELLGEFPTQMMTGKGWSGFGRAALKAGRKLKPMTYMMNDYLSYGKKAIDIYLTSKEVKDTDIGEKIKPYRQFLGLISELSMFNELYLHSRRDGRIHSLVVPSTNTGRDTSSAPNLQNPKMDVIRGVLTGDPGCVLTELDLSNAENVMAAGVSGDSKLAAATEDGDFHVKMAKIYFADKWKVAGEAERLILRKQGKPITFGTAYGMQAFSLQIDLRKKGVYLSNREIKIILTDKDKAFPGVIRKKNQMVLNCKKRVIAGFMPAYISLWSGERVCVHYDDGGQKIQYDNGWNYAQQGGVATIVHRAITEIDEWLEDEKKVSRIAVDIHDSGIGNTDVEEAAEVLVKSAEFMGSQVPEEFLRRTTPRIHFVAAIGPENAKKWGYVDGQDYQLPMDKFYNQWGVHTLAEGEDEAPTWRGPVHLGWTLEKETEAIKRGDSLDDMWDGQAAIVTEVSIVDGSASEPSIKHVTDAVEMLKNLDKGYDVLVPSKNGGGPTKIHLGSEVEVMKSSLSTLSSKGHHLAGESVRRDIKVVNSVIDTAITFLEEKKKELESIYEELPDLPKSPGTDTKRKSAGHEKQESVG